MRAHGWQCPPTRIVAAVDFEGASSRAITLAGFIAAATGASLRVVHAECFEPPPYFTLEQIVQLEDERRQASESVAAELRRFVQAATAWPAEVLVTDGPPVDAVLRATEDADLAVLGTHGRRGPSRWWLGSVAERVVRGSRIPVLVTRADAVVESDVFARVALVAADGEPGDEARGCAEQMAATGRGSVEVVPTLAGCPPEVLARASLVVVDGRARRSTWGLPDVVANALGQCSRPVLFLPAV
jgi:nucleotide-binding universal stress UspA family protein